MQSLTRIYDPTGTSKWSRAEKAIARKVFDSALTQELDEVKKTAQKRAAGIKEPADVWRLEAYLTRLRNEIDKEYQVVA